MSTSVRDGWDCSVAKFPTDKVRKRYRIRAIGKMMHYHAALISYLALILEAHWDRRTELIALQVCLVVAPQYPSRRYLTLSRFVSRLDGMDVLFDGHIMR